MLKVAEALAEEFHLTEEEKKNMDISRTDRFSFYKVGPVLSVSVSEGFILFNIVFYLTAWDGRSFYFDTIA